ncbi:MAG TPA: helix-turn-helix domain-containing protein [Solirubrobacteraceae bacterium]|nr:helix-turn-helix domain-containing protein [Solirubrobacteraceae bacterium]
MTTGPGLRERKNARTRAAIVRAALELTLERGFEGATLSQIAERADVSRGTLFTWFASKEDIVLRGLDAHIDALLAALDATEGDTVDRLERWMAGQGERIAAEEDELSRLRTRAILADPHLRALQRTHLDVAERAIAASAARETGLPAEGLASQAFAAAAVSILGGLQERFAAEDHERGDGTELRTAFTLLRDMLTGMRAAGAPGAGPGA